MSGLDQLTIDEKWRTFRRNVAQLSGECPIDAEVIEPAAEATAADKPAAVLPVDDPREFSLLAIAELLLKDRRRLHRMLDQPAGPRVLLPRLLAIALAGFLLFGVTISLVMSVTGRWVELTSIASWLDEPRNDLFTFTFLEGKPLGELAPWFNGQALGLIAAYAFGLVAATCVCLPSLYFYCLLSGLRMSMVEVVVHAIKSKAVAAVALVGILPIYLALAMGVSILNANEGYTRMIILLGLVLPFVAGFWGTAALHATFSQLCDRMPARNAWQRRCFLRRLVLSWSGIYSVVMPVMIYSVWELLS